MQSAAFPGQPIPRVDCNNHEKARPPDPDGCCSNVNTRSVNSHDPKNLCLASLQGGRDGKFRLLVLRLSNAIERIHTPRRNEWNGAGRATRSITEGSYKLKARCKQFMKRKGRACFWHDECYKARQRNSCGAFSRRGGVVCPSIAAACGET
jgi:hypothetical protein